MAYMKTESKYYRFLIKRNSRMIGLYSIILIAAFPLLLYFLGANEDMYDFTLYAFTGQALDAGIALIASIIIPLSIFKYTSSKRSMDVYDALPLQKETMFRINYLAGLTILIIPFIVTWIIGSIYTISVVTSSTETSRILFENINVYSYSAQFIRLFELLAPMVLCYSITVFVKQNTGSIVDAAIYTGIIHALPMLAYWAFFAYCSTTLLGFAEEWSFGLFQYLAPAVSIFRIIGNDTTGFLSVSRFFYYLVFTIILFISSSYLYINHRSEKCEQPFTTKHFFPIVSNLSAIVILILLISAMNADIFAFNLDNIQVVYPILLSGIIYLLLDVIAHRGFKNIYRAAVRYICIALISIALLAPISFTKGFGYVTRIPERDDIISIDFDIPYPVAEMYGINQSRITITSQENIDKVINYHEHLLDRYSDYNYHSYAVYINDTLKNDYPHDVYANNRVYYISITYHTENGDIIRKYHVPIVWTSDLLNLTINEELLEAKLQPELLEFANDKETYRITCSSLSFDETLGYQSAEAIEQQFDIYKFLDVYRKDLENRTDIYDYAITSSTYTNLNVDLNIICNDPDTSTYGRQFTSMYMNFTVENCDMNTIAYLDSIGYTPSIIDEENFQSAYVIEPGTNASSMLFYNSLFFDDFYLASNIPIIYTELEYNDIIELEPYMRNEAYYPEGGYLICVQYGYDNRLFLVSNEHSELVENMIHDKEHIESTTTSLLNTHLNFEKY